MTEPLYERPLKTTVSISVSASFHPNRVFSITQVTPLVQGDNGQSQPS